MISKKRHLAKALSWRFLGTIDTMLIGWVVSGNLLVGISIGSIEIVTKIFLYYFHERIWYKFSKFGVEKTKEEIRNNDDN
tara:strand:+ start:372 stop:611 length:240 start_codon:yes stop_codon:yes gene_type:complete